MDLQTFEKEFGHFAEAPNGIQKLRELILQLAVQGKLVEQDPKDEPAERLLQLIKDEKLRLAQNKQIKIAINLSPIKNEDKLFSEPHNWTWCRLDHLCYQITDGTHFTPKYTDSGIPFLSVKDITKGFIDLSHTRFISAEEHSQLSKRCNPEKYDILFTKVGTTGIAKVIDIDIEFSIFVSLALFKFPTCYICPYFLELLLNSPIVKQQSSDNTQGVGNKNLVLKHIKNFIVPLPPYNEQKRIVAKVDQLMALCDALAEKQRLKREAHSSLNTTCLHHLTTAPDEAEFTRHWQRIAKNFNQLYTTPQSVSQLRQAILQLAVQGKLVEQDPGEESADKLLSRIEELKSKLVKEKKIKTIKPQRTIENDEYPFQKPPGWEFVRLGTIQNFVNGYAFKSDEYSEDGIGIIRIGDIQNGEIKVEDMKFVPLRYKDLLDKSLLVEPEDLVIAMSGATTGKLGFNKTNNEYLLNQRVGKIDFFIVDKIYGFYFLTTKIRENLNISSGSAIPNLSTTQINDIIFPLPPLEEQNRIVAKVDQLMALCDILEAKLTQGEQTSEKLLNAVVHYIAEGRLDSSAEEQSLALA